MPMRLEGACACGAVRFSVDSHTPHPYQLCYCSICRRSSGGGGCAINLAALATSLRCEGEKATRFFHAPMNENGRKRRSTAERHYCSKCGSPLWVFSPEWPDLLHPIASAISTELPVPPERVHMMLSSRASWCQPAIGPGDQCFQAYPEESIEDWHRARGLWVD